MQFIYIILVAVFLYLVFYNPAPTVPQKPPTIPIDYVNKPCKNPDNLGDDMLIHRRQDISIKADNMKWDPVTGMRRVDFNDCYTDNCVKLAKEACLMPLVDQDVCYGTQQFGKNEVYPHHHTLMNKENNFAQVTNNIMTDLPCDCRSRSFEVCPERKKVHEVCFRKVLQQCATGRPLDQIQ